MECSLTIRVTTTTASQANQFFLLKYTDYFNSVEPEMFKLCYFLLQVCDTYS